jgi:hypothetical protein
VDPNPKKNEFGSTTLVILYRGKITASCLIDNPDAKSVLHLNPLGKKIGDAGTNCTRQKNMPPFLILTKLPFLFLLGN